MKKQDTVDKFLKGCKNEYLENSSWIRVFINLSFWYTSGSMYYLYDLSSIDTNLNSLIINPLYKKKRNDIQKLIEELDINKALYEAVTKKRIGKFKTTTSIIEEWKKYGTYLSSKDGLIELPGFWEDKSLEYLIKSINNVSWQRIKNCLAT